MAGTKHARTALIIIGSLLVGAGLAITTVILIHRHTEPLLPAQVTDNANFLLYAPQQNTEDTKAWNLSTPEPRFDKQAGTVTMTLKQASSGTSITLTQQVTPGVFNDVPQQYANMLNALHQYDELQTAFGTVTLTHPEELKGSQTAVVNKSSSLLFARPSHDLTRDDWQQFFESLRIVR